MELTYKENIVIEFIKREGGGSPEPRVLTQCNCISNEKITKATLNSLVKKGLLSTFKSSVGVGCNYYSIPK